MGYFQETKTVTVSSTIYNLAGDIATRPNFVKTTITGAILSDQPDISGTLIESLVSGPGTRLRSFGRWARNTTTYYDGIVAQQESTLLSGGTINNDLLLQQIPDATAISSSVIGSADYSYWSRQYMEDNHPTVPASDWTDAFDEPTASILVTFDGTSESFVAADYDDVAKYLYATYSKAGTSQVYTFIYRQNSGNPTLDLMFGVTAAMGRFYPYIPIRVDKVMISDAYLPSVYAANVKAVPKAMGTNAKYDDIVDKLNTTPSIGDIDYAYIVFGASLNSPEQSARRYIYEFFQQASLGFDLSGAGFQQWKDAYNASAQSQIAHDNWAAAQASKTPPLYGTPEPAILPSPLPPSVAIEINSAALTWINYDMIIYWSSILETSGAGTKAAVGEYAWEIDDDITFGFSNPLIPAYLMSHVKLYWQETATTWHCLDITGLMHQNNIYKGNNAIFTSASQALGDPNESGFIIPLHEDIFNKIPLVQATQLSTACCYLVLNSYTIVTQKWYQTGLFQIVLVIIIIIITILTWGAGSVLGAGLLGTDAAVGAAVGLTGTAALIAGAIINALAAIIVTKILTYGAKAAFGPEIGGIIGTIASLVVIAAGTAASSGQSLTTSFDGLMKADNLIKLTEAAGKGYDGYIQSEIADTQKQSAAFTSETDAETTKINQAVQANLPGGVAAINPLATTDTPQSYVLESLDTFLSRTLMTGSDIAELTLSMVTDFVDLTVNVDLPT